MREGDVWLPYLKGLSILFCRAIGMSLLLSLDSDEASSKQLSFSSPFMYLEFSKHPNGDVDTKPNFLPPLLYTSYIHYSLKFSAYQREIFFLQTTTKMLIVIRKNMTHYQHFRGCWTQGNE